MQWQRHAPLHPGSGREERLRRSECPGPVAQQEFLDFSG